MAKHDASLARKYAKRASSVRPVAKKHVKNKRKRTLAQPALSPLYLAREEAAAASVPEQRGKKARRGAFSEKMGRMRAALSSFAANLRLRFAEGFFFLRDELFDDPGSFFRKLGFHFTQGVRKTFSAVSYLSRYVLIPLSVAMVVGVMALFSAYTIGIEVTLEGETIGYVSDRASFETAKTEAENTVSARINDSYQLSAEPVYKLGLVPKSKIAETEDISGYIAEISTDRIGKTYALYVDGQIIGTYARESAIQEMLENLKRPYATGVENETVDFNKDVQIQYGVYSEQFEMSINDMRNKLLSSETPVIEYSVKEEDSVSTIASSFQVDGNTIQNLNPNVDLDNLDTGSRILVPSSQPMLSVIVRRTVSYVEEIPYETTVSESADLWRGMEQVVTRGEAGEREVVADLILVDGVEVSRETKSETILREPVDEVKLIGTKKVTANASGSYGSGNYLWPVNGGALTAYFSDWRSNHYHNALDIAAAYGTEIYATDSGQVIYAGWSGGGHGYNVWIDHGNGITSRYSHCSAVLVETGQMVGQGQPICLIGATGWAYGNHVHFVIEANGVPIDPLPLIS